MVKVPSERIRERISITAAIQMDRKDIIRNLRYLSQILEERGVQGEIVLYGGAAMLLAFDARPMTKDVDAVFKPEREVLDAAHDVSIRYGAPVGWLNDAVSVFTSSHEQLKIAIQFPNLSVYTASPEYLLAMKCISMRLGEDAKDLEDIKLLIEKLSITSTEEITKILAKYYPRQKISDKTRLVMEELFSQEE